ncbi:MAG TPA: tyrosine-type recombinase/integrase [Thermomicrobiales bacterium]|nr:tyrosine-type recombinase/integrase [Thermomicrobiales bacterium]
MTKPSRTLRYGDGFLTQRGDATVQARWKDGPKMRAKTFRGETLEHAWEQAEDHLRQIARDRRDGRYTSPSDLTIKQLLEEYRDRGATRWSMNTQATYGQLVTTHIVPHLGSRRIIDLTPRMVQLWIDGLHKQGLSAAVIENAKIVLSGACREAVQMGIMRMNPTSGLRLPAKPKSRMPTWTSAEVYSVLTAISEIEWRKPYVELWMRTFYTLAITTGMRPGELRALMWKDVDLEDGRLTCHRSMTRDPNFKTIVGEQTKGGRARVIAIPEETVAILKEYRRAQVTRRLGAIGWFNTGIVLDRGNGNHIPLTTLENRHKQVIAHAGVTSIRLHDLRHTAATLLLEADAHPKIVSDLLGHSSIAITMDRYVHVSTDLQRSATNVLGSIISGTNKGQKPA